MLLGLVLGMVGTRVGAALVFEGTALRDCVGGAQASDHDAPSQPPPRLLDSEATDCEGEGDGKDDRDEQAGMADLAHELLELGRVGARPVAYVDRRGEATQRIREGHGARGPPRA